MRPMGLVIPVNGNLTGAALIERMCYIEELILACKSSSHIIMGSHKMFLLRKETEKKADISTDLNIII